MNSLLHAGFFRLKKNRLFWVGVALMAVLGAWIPVNNYLEYRAIDLNILPSLEGFLNGHAIFVPIALSAAISLFVGTEYSDGALRNKLIVGHTRWQVYLSTLLVNLTDSLVLSLAYLAGCLASGLPLLGPPELFTPEVLLANIGGAFAAELTICALLTLASLLCSRKSGAVVICILGLMGMLLFSTMLQSALDQPEFHSNYEMSVNGEIKSGEMVPNPAYVGGVKRQVYEFLMEFLPTGQMVRYINFEVPRLWLPPVYSMLIFTAATAAGLIFFQRKNLK